LGKAAWQVEQLVRYFRDHAGIASTSTAEKRKIRGTLTQRTHALRCDIGSLLVAGRALG
jgi:hypothetical protein